MTSGTVTNVSPRTLGGALLTAVTAGATVLPVDNAGDFDEEFDEPRWLVLGESLTPLQYVAVENDDDAAVQSVTLAVGVAANVEAGTPITLWDPTVESTDKKRAITFRAWVHLDEQPEVPPKPATIPHTLIPYGDAYGLVGARVALAYLDNEWTVESVLGRVPEIGSEFLRIPFGLGIFNADESWPNGLDTWQTVKNFAAYDLVGMTYNFLTGIWTVQQEGLYEARFGATFAENATNARGVRPRFHYVEGGSAPLRAVRLQAISRPTGLEVSMIPRRMYPGQGLSFEANQTSGAALDLLGSNGDLNNRPTECAIWRVAP